MPVIKNESQVVSDFDLCSSVISSCESFTHDGNQHIYKMDKNHESGQIISDQEECLETGVMEAQREGRVIC